MALEEEWLLLKDRLMRVDLDGIPYAYTKRTYNYDFEVTFHTPFAQVAAFVQRNAKNPGIVTQERCLSLPSLGRRDGGGVGHGQREGAGRGGECPP